MTGYPGETAAATTWSTYQLVPWSQLEHQRNIREILEKCASMNWIYLNSSQKTLL